MLISDVSRSQSWEIIKIIFMPRQCGSRDHGCKSYTGHKVSVHRGDIVTANWGGLFLYANKRVKYYQHVAFWSVLVLLTTLHVLLNYFVL